jgi:hypothetical protein
MHYIGGFVSPGKGLDAVEKCYFSLSVIELRFLGDPAFGLVTIATEFNNKRPVLNPRTVHVGSVVNKALSPSSSTFPCKLSLHLCSIFMLPGAGTICPFGSSVQTRRCLVLWRWDSSTESGPRTPGGDLLPSGIPDFANIF